jgi:putative protease
MQQRSAIRKPEIMSPAGYWPQLEAAIEAGADAVYFGLKHFSARAKVGFSLGELPEVMRALHRRGVRGYVTFNTLVFEHEMEEAARTIAALAEAGADALIVQDAGMMRLARRIAPDIELHGSTQMSITSAEGVRLAQSLGAGRVTLARELSLGEIETIVAQSSCGIEIFVHGALCVAYSGQCLSSEAWGGRSANRGQCAQACRLPYEMLVDGELRPLGDARYLLSPGDLYALAEIPKIVNSGVAALKIEGRYKAADYVALTTRAYRKAVDEAWEGRPSSVTRAEQLQLEQVYSRGLGPFFLSGTNHQAVVKGRAPRHRGVWMGRVTGVAADAVTMETNEVHELAPLKAGDGIVFDAADWRSPEEPEEGGRVFEVQPGLDGGVRLRFGNGAIRFSRIRAGDLLWRTSDPDIERQARPFAEAPGPVQKQPVRVRVTAHEGAPLIAEWSLVARPEVQVMLKSPVNLEPAQHRGVSLSLLREQFGRLGNTPYELRDLELDASGSPFAPVSVLNHVRRQAVEQLQALQSRPSAIHAAEPVETLRSMLPDRALQDRALQDRASQDRALQDRALQDRAEAPFTQLPVAELHVMVRTPEQLEAALTLGAASITLDYLDLYGLRPSVERVKSSGIQARVASPRVLKPGESRILNFLLSLDCPLVVRASGMLETLRGKDHPVLIGDFSLNAANSLAASTFMDLGLSRVTPAYDLNAAQVADLARDVGAGKIEAVAYQHLPVFHTEHCVFCRFLSSGTSYRDCGRPCEKHRVALRDQSGRAHPVIADVGCRNTVFGAEAQEASAHLEDWRRAGIRHFRLEFVHESASQVRRVFSAFEAALRGSMTAAQLARELRAIAPEGTSEGSLFVPREYLVLPILQ